MNFVTWLQSFLLLDGQPDDKFNGLSPKNNYKYSFVFWKHFILTLKYFFLAGRNFGDEGLFFLAESLGYNQVLVFLLK